MNNLIPTYKCAYKIPNKEGWYIELGDYVQGKIEEKFESSKYLGQIIEYQLFLGGKRNPETTQPKTIDNFCFWILLRDYWGYSPDTKMWYAKDELLPEPQRKTEIADNFQINYEIEDEDDLIEYVEAIKKDENNVNDTGLLINITFKTETQEYTIALEYHRVINELKKFLIDIENGKSARLYVYEYSEDSFHIWQKDNEIIRFVIQNSLEQGLNFIFDETMPKELFLNQFKGIIAKIENQIQEHSQ